MPRAYSYIRMSTDLQLVGDSLRRQTELSERFATEHGLELDRTLQLRDIGVSAFHGANVETGGLGRFLEAVRQGHVAKGSFLLVESLDRLTRQKFRESVRLFLDITDAGINVVTLSDGHVYKAGETDLDQLLVPFLIMSRANEESELKSFRLRKAWEEKRRRIGECKLTARCPAWVSLAADKGSFSLVDERVAIVRQIFDWAENGAGTYVIVKRLNAAGHRPFGKASQWVSSSVAKLLTNRAVLGEFYPGRGSGAARLLQTQPVFNYFPAIISEDQFVRVRSARRNRATGGGGRIGASKRNLFTHIARCGYCGGAMHLVNKGPNPKGGIYLRCSNALAGGRCVGRSWRYDDFEKSFLYFTREADLASVLARGSATRLLTLQERIRTVDELIESLSAKRERVFSLVDDNDQFDSSYVKSKLDSVESELRDLRTEREQLLEGRSEEISAADTPEQISDAIAQIQSAADTSLEVRMKLAARLSRIIRSLRVFPGRSRLSSLPPSATRYEAADVSKDRHFFVVEFIDGTFRTVHPTSSDPFAADTNIRMSSDGPSYELTN